MKKREIRLAVVLAEREVERLKAEIETMRRNWRPVPITHPWQPRNPQCALCDETRDAPRHQVEQ
jgi:hypothetical protein